MTSQEAPNLRDLIAMLRRRLGLALAVAGAVVLAAFLLAAWLPNEYEAYATILVAPQTISKRLVEAGVEESDINQRLHLMTMEILSRPRLSRIIDELRLYHDEWDEKTRDEIIDEMQDDIRVEPVLPELGNQRRGGTEAVEINTFRVFFRYPSPAVAAAVANELANDFIDEHIKERVRVSSDTAEFIDSELQRLSARIREVEAKIAEIKAKNVGSLPEDLDANQRLLERTIDNLRAAERELAQARSDEAFYRQQAIAAASLGGGNGQTDPATRIQALELQLAQLRSRGYTDKHPDVIATQEEIAKLKAKIEESKGKGGEVGPRSLAEVNAEAERQRAALRAKAAEREVDRLRKQVEALEERIAATPRVAEQLDSLQREYEHLAQSYQEYSQKRLEAQVAANMERGQKGEQFRVLEAAFEPTQPVSPNRPLIVALGAMLGVAFGGLLALLAEGLDSSFHDARALQQTLRVPVLAAVPSIWLEADRRALRRRRLVRALLGGLVVVVALGSAAVGYLRVNAEAAGGGGGAPAATPTRRAPGGTPS